MKEEYNIITVNITQKELEEADREIEYSHRGYKYPIVTKLEDIYSCEKYSQEEYEIVEAYIHNSKYGKGLLDNEDLQDNLYNFLDEYKDIYKINPTLTLLQNTKNPPPYIDHAEQFYTSRINPYDGTEYCYRTIVYHPYKSRVDRTCQDFNEVMDNWVEENNFHGNVYISDDSWYNDLCYKVVIEESHYDPELDEII